MRKINKEFFKKNFKILIVVFVAIGVLIYKFFDKSNVVEGYENAYNFTYNSSSESFVVEVKGEVNRPGVYIVMEDYRVSDIIDLAQGFTTSADTSSINLASKITDGMQIVVKEIAKDSEENKISINSASLEELKKIPNIGEAKAKNIIKYREENGYFKSIEEIINVSGISENLFEQIKEYICL